MERASHKLLSSDDLKFWKMGTKLGCSRTCLLGWLSGAPLCSVSGPKRSKKRKKSQGQMSKPINTGWPGDQGEASRVGSGVGAGPSAQNLGYLHSPGGNTLTRTSCQEPDRQVEHLSSSSNYLHQGDGPSCPSRWVFGQWAFPPDLEPRPEALIALKKKKKNSRN